MRTKYWFSKGVFHCMQVLCLISVLFGFIGLAEAFFKRNESLPLRGQPMSTERMESIQENRMIEQTRRDDLGLMVQLAIFGVAGWASLTVFIAILDASAHVQTLRTPQNTIPESPRSQPPLQRLVTSTPRPSDDFLEPATPTPPPRPAPASKPTLPTPMDLPAVSLLDLDALDQQTADAIAKRKP